MNTKKSFKIIIKVYKLIFSFTDQKLERRIRNTEFETKPANVNIKTSSIKI